MASFDDQEYGTTESDSIAKEYDESSSYQGCVRCCGRCWFLTLVFCTVAWIAHSIVLAQPDPCFNEILEARKVGRDPLCSDEDILAGRAHFDLAPAFSKTLIWMSMAHHTEPWQEHWRRSAPPPPPNFF